MSISPKDNNVFKYIYFSPARLSEKLKAEVSKEQIRREKLKKQKDIKREHRLSERESLIKALNNLQSLNLSKDVELDDTSSFLSITSSGERKLSAETKNILKSLGLDLSTSHLELVNNLNSVLANSDYQSPTANPSPQPSATEGRIQDVGTAKLYVVKQQIKRYEAGEIAHIENVQAGETKIRTHSKTLKSEEFFSTITDTTVETETELETTERFELNKETSKTFSKDTELGMELSLSGKYGPTISFDSNFNAGQSTSTSTASEQATSFAKDTIERSKERIVEQVTIKQEKTLIRKIKEKNQHTLSNTDASHKFAIYQYVDKIYESQVFDYGIRQMFDFMIPEPSSFLWYMKSKTAYKLEATAPDPLEEALIYEPKDITKYNYQRLGVLYGVTDLPPPPDIFVTKRFRMLHGTGAGTDSGKHKTGISSELDIPKGYQPNLANIEILATSDETLAFSLSIGGNTRDFKKADFEAVSVLGGHKRYHLINKKIMALGHDQSLTSQQKLYFDIYGYESANYAFHFEIRFYALYDPSVLEYVLISKWKQEVYAKLVEAYQIALFQYEQQQAYLLAEAEAQDIEEVDFGNPPAANKKIIETELKKHCLSIIQDQPAGILVTPHTGEPPTFNSEDAKRDGEIIRFLEIAFEWSQMQYVFYPYFWARQDFDQDQESTLKGWRDRFVEKNNDFTMQQFMKAGYARVVVPVRENFQDAVSHFIETGEVYFGLGEPKFFNPLYVSITDEIKERTGAGQGEVPVGDPWETRLPTAAIIVKDLDQLPKWVKVNGEDWKWELSD